MSSTLLIRPFQSRDRAAVEALWTRVFPDDPARNAPARLIDAKLAIQPELLFVGFVSEELAGAVIAGFDGIRGWLYHLAVAPEWRRQGFATQLVRESESSLRKLGCTKVNLQVRSGNAAVVGFYEALGYAVEERVSMGRALGSTG